MASSDIDPTSGARDVAGSASPNGVLLVEDSMIIAMDAEEMLRQIGFAKVAIAGSVDGAMAELDANTPLFAMLDFNLGDSTSEEVAERLSAEGVPFWFVTGYGEAVKQLSDTMARGVLQKPYTRQDIEALVASLNGAANT
ncbi:response regulator [Aurantiacibacter sp. MUD11]|uniref:response regulator n=1 Tax=Aurantiacibacter sp. MUD11 TaxID=3003265 RepID=UPI0022AA86EA|nr:response regulator [Aurantiacibacter sp. MUD11]WAT17479.1 response regulator [Aurantiacibacter sp. MUD11]